METACVTAVMHLPPLKKMKEAPSPENFLKFPLKMFVCEDMRAGFHQRLQRQPEELRFKRPSLHFQVQQRSVGEKQGDSS